MAHRVVDDFGAVDQPLVRAAGTRHVDARLVAAGSVCRAAGEHALGALVPGLCGRGCSRRRSRTPVEDTRGLEATVGIEPTMKVLQTSALPLGYVAEPHMLCGRSLACRVATRSTGRSTNARERASAGAGRSLTPVSRCTSLSATVLPLRRRCGGAAGRARLRRHDEADVEGTRRVRAVARRTPPYVVSGGVGGRRSRDGASHSWSRVLRKTLARDHLLTDRRPVVDADARGLDLAVGERAAVVAVGLALQALAVVRRGPALDRRRPARSGGGRRARRARPGEAARGLRRSMCVLRGVDDAACASPRAMALGWTGRPVALWLRRYVASGRATEHLLRKYTAVRREAPAS